jgi:plasmid stabilization system protein ParE
MAHRLSPQAESDLESLWQYVAADSASWEIADRLIESITSRFLLITRYPGIGRSRDQDCDPAYVVFR